MSGSHPVSEQTTRAKGVVVRKRFETDEFPVPAVVFNFESSRTYPITVRLVDRVPETVEVEDLGFHPEYGSEFWTVDDEQLTFERELAPGEEYTTVYGVRAAIVENSEAFMTDPTLETVKIPSGDETGGEPIESAVPGDTNVVRDALGGAEVSIPGLDDQGGDGNGDDAEETELDLGIGSAPDADSADADRTDEGDDSREQHGSSGAEETAEPDSVLTPEVAPSSPGDSTDGEDNPAEPAGADRAESLAGKLAAEIERGAVPDDELDRLRDALATEPRDGESNDEKDDPADPSRVVTAKLEQLQTDIADLRAYTGALEAFLEENGTGEELIADLETTQERLDALDEQLDTTEATIEAVREEVTVVDDGLDDLEDSVGSLESQLETKAPAEKVDTLEQTIEQLDETIEQKARTDRLEALEQTVAELDEGLDRAADAEELADVHERLEELEEFREQIVNTFG